MLQQSGAVGSNALQLAKHVGAQVTAVTSGANTELVTGLGADHVIDCTTNDLAAINARFDIVLDCVGNLTIHSDRPPSRRRWRALAGCGEPVDSVRAHGNVVAGSAPERVPDIEFLLDLVARGHLTVVHDGSYDLAHIVDAYRRVDSGHTRGNVIAHPWPARPPSSAVSEAMPARSGIQDHPDVPSMAIIRPESITIKATPTTTATHWAMFSFITCPWRGAA